MAQSNPYMQMSGPQYLHGAGGPSFSLGQPAFSIAQAVSDISTTANNLASTSATNGSSSTGTAFRAPAHKHAHHLHSIPPREKSTRTLIIDHMLWVHGRTRFAQARAELGMTDRTGGPTSTNYIHRQRPENYEEEEEEPSDGEDVVRLKARDGGPGYNDDEDERIRKQDLSLARSLRLRAEGLEKVVVSMLEQPPPLHPLNDDDLFTPSTSPKLHPVRDPAHPHRLPNGVRLRLALGTMINDLFARQAPLPPYRHQQHSTPNPSVPSTPSEAATPSPNPINCLPQALTSLATISAIGHAHIESPQIPPSTLGGSPRTVRHNAAPVPSSRTRSLYMVGADPSTANSPPAFRCPRHLHTSCEICVEAKSINRPTANASRKSGNDSSGVGNQNGAAKTGTAGGGITGWQDGCGVGSGLARPGMRGSVLRRKPNLGGNPEAGEGQGPRSTGAGNTKLSELIPRFVRLSALVATELGREAKEGYEENEQVADSSDDPFVYTLRPSREWYMLLAGLLTRAVLEGYLTGGWRGLEAVECLLAVGLGIVDGNESSDPEPAPPEEFEEFDPDELPSLADAAKTLFPALKSGASPRKGNAEVEFEMDMDERLRRFYDIPASTPDLSTHMEDLAWQYPAEPVERAAVRFCEAIAKWRGKPELETYKKKPPAPPRPRAAPADGAMAIEALVHSSPTSPMLGGNMSSSPMYEPRPRRPEIEKYFIYPASVRDGAWNRNKRTRPPEDDRNGKRMRA